MAYQNGLGEDAPDLIKALTRLLEVMVSSFGALGTIGIFVFLLLVAFLWRRYNDWQKDKTTDALLAEKERTIQRLAEESRNFKILFLKHQLGWTDEQINLFIMKNEFIDGVTARKALEGEEIETEAEEHPVKPPRLKKGGKKPQR